MLNSFIIIVLIVIVESIFLTTTIKFSKVQCFSITRRKTSSSSSSLLSSSSSSSLNRQYLTATLLLAKYHNHDDNNDNTITGSNDNQYMKSKTSSSSFVESNNSYDDRDNNRNNESDNNNNIVMESDFTKIIKSKTTANRRYVIQSGYRIGTTTFIASLASSLFVSTSTVHPSFAISTNNQFVLESRVYEKDNNFSPPSYTMELSDIFYPKWFIGIWNVTSKTDSIIAPCGISLFGSNVSYQKAMSEIGTDLKYTTRFLPIVTTNNNNNENNLPTNAIADREYNIISIAQAAMGMNSIVNIPFISPNKLTAYVAPTNSPSILKVDMITLNRKQEIINEYEFHCSEIVREIVSSSTSPSSSTTATTIATTSSPAMILKDIETISLYKYNPITDTVSCIQRSASFLVPSQQSYIALKMWEATGGRPVDVRRYSIQYTKNVKK